MKPILKFFNLTSEDRNLLLKTFVLLGLVRLGLWLLSFGTLRQFLANINQLSSKHQRITQIELNRIVWAIDLSSRYWFGEVKCLARALTAQVLMNSYGYCPQLRIGVTKAKEGDLEAHAWVENEGNVVIGYLKDLSRFTPLESLEGEGR